MQMIDKDIVKIVNGGEINGNLDILSDGNIALNYSNNTLPRPFLSICIICAHASLKTEKALHKSAIILQIFNTRNCDFLF